MKQNFYIETYEQLRAISDPLKVKILSYTIEKAYTGKQLADKLELSASKVHYHLRELENLGMIEVVNTEIKNGIVQKFYKSVAYDMVISESLLPNQGEIKDSLQHGVYMLISRGANRVMHASEDAFLYKETKEKTPVIASQYEVKINEEKLLAWMEKYRALKREFMDLHDESDPAARWFYFVNGGFYIDEPLFEETEEEKEKNDNKSDSP